MPEKPEETRYEDWYEVMGDAPDIKLGKAEREIFNYSVENYTKESYAIAYQGFSELAGKGSTQSQYFLGVMFLKGYGVLQDFVQAHTWFNIAASRGHKKSRAHLDKITAKMSAEQVAEAQKQAREWVETKVDVVDNPQDD